MEREPVYELEALRNKVKADVRFLKLLLDDYAIKPGEEHRVRASIASTVQNYPTLFSEEDVK